MTVLSSLRAGVLGIALMVASGPAAMAQDAVVEALGVPGPIEFMGESFALSWTSHPMADYFKQEYLPEGQKAESYAAMFMIDVLTSKASPQEVANSQIAALEQRKPNDRMVNYSQISNTETGDVILDFLISDDSGPSRIVEWDAYRYTKLGEGVAMYAISHRAYGGDVVAFVGALAQMRKDNIGALASFELPPITPAQ